MVSVRTISLIGLSAILAAEPLVRTAVRDARVDVAWPRELLTGVRHLDQRAAGDREVVDDQDILARDSCR